MDQIYNLIEVLQKTLFFFMKRLFSNLLSFPLIKYLENFFNLLEFFSDILIKFIWG